MLSAKRIAELRLASRLGKKKAKLLERVARLLRSGLNARSCTVTPGVRKALEEYEAVRDALQELEGG